MINFYNNGTTYICVVQRGNEWKICVEDSFIDSNNIVAIHKKHESILNAVLSDNSVEILATLAPKTVSTIKGCDFISTYNESWDYLLVEKETLTIKDGDKVYEFEKPDFEIVLDRVVNGKVFGFKVEHDLMCFWDEKGICTVIGAGVQLVQRFYHNECWNLTPIVKEKPWYEVESNFPRICWYGNRELESVIMVKNKVKYLKYINHAKTLDPLTNEEIESLKVK